MSCSHPISGACLETYENSWKSIQALHSLLKLHARGKVSGSFDESDPLLVKLENTCVWESTRSYLDVQVQVQHVHGGIEWNNANAAGGEDVNVASCATNEERLATSRLSSIQEALDDTIRQVFPLKKHSNHHPVAPRHDDGDDAGVCDVKEISVHATNLLQSYKDAVRTRHQMAFLPKR